MRLLIPCYDLSTIRNSLQENLQLREIGAESGCQNVANSLYFSLLAANLGERLAPDCSLYQIFYLAKIPNVYVVLSTTVLPSL